MAGLDKCLSDLADLELELVGVIKVGEEKPCTVKTWHRTTNEVLRASNHSARNRVTSNLATLSEAASAHAVKHEELTRAVPSCWAAVAVSEDWAAAIRDGLKLSNITVQIENTWVVNNLAAKRHGIVVLKAVLIKVDIRSTLELLGVAESKSVWEELSNDKVSHNDLARNWCREDEVVVPPLTLTLSAESMPG